MATLPESSEPELSDSRQPSVQIARLDELNRRALEGGGAERTKKQHGAGKLTARE